MRMRGVVAAAVAVAGFGWVATGFAGKPERDKQTELKPAVAAAEASVKTACGCAGKITVKWETFPKADDMFRVANTCEDITMSVKAQCQSADDKKAYCTNVTGYEISFSKDGGSANLKGKVIQLTSNDSGHPGEGLIGDILKKF